MVGVKKAVIHWAQDDTITYDVDDGLKAVYVGKNYSYVVAKRSDGAELVACNFQYLEVTPL